VSTPELTLTQRPAAPRSPERDEAWLRAARRARQLSWLSLVWMTAEGLIGVIAGLVAGSVALLGFGLDSAIEGAASVIVIWRFTGSRTHSETSERRAQRAVAVSFFLLAPYITFDAARALVTTSHPEVSWVGIGLAATSLVIMPLLGKAKQRLGRQLGSAATAGEGKQNLLCAYLAAAVLVGLAANAAFGLWWLDPVAALYIAFVAVQEGREAWRGDDCC
jgi:divalent metal cation (Fe/Co/Zn/Cd) transporter